MRAENYGILNIESDWVNNRCFNIKHFKVHIEFTKRENFLIKITANFIRSNIILVNVKMNTIYL